MPRRNRTPSVPLGFLLGFTQAFVGCVQTAVAYQGFWLFPIPKSAKKNRYSRTKVLHTADKNLENTKKPANKTFQTVPRMWHQIQTTFLVLFFHELMQEVIWEKPLCTIQPKSGSQIIARCRCHNASYQELLAIQISRTAQPLCSECIGTIAKFLSLHRQRLCRIPSSTTEPSNFGMLTLITSVHANLA